MITIESIRERYGTVFDTFADECQSLETYEVEGGVCGAITFPWQTPYRLDATIALVFEEGGLCFYNHLNRQPVTLGRLCSWTTPKHRLLRRLRESKADLDGYRLPPLGIDPQPMRT